MASRYLVTGVQLGMLIGMDDQDDRQSLVDEIVDKQYIGNSDQPVEKDATDIAKITLITKGYIK